MGPPSALTHVATLEGWPVTALAWDKGSSFLWIGTDGGLTNLRADGTGWKACTWTTEDSGLAAGRVTALALGSIEPGQTQVWIGTPCGLSCYHHRY